MLRTRQPQIMEIKIVLSVVSCSAPAGIWQGFPPSFLFVVVCRVSISAGFPPGLETGLGNSRPNLGMGWKVLRGLRQIPCL